jgi:glucose/arabinose dehydrogenase
MCKTKIMITLLAMLVITAACQSNSGHPPAPTSLPLADGQFSESQNAPAHPVYLPQGFGISVFAQGLDDPTMLAFSPAGELYVSDTSTGRILRLPDRDGDGIADGIEVAAENLVGPSGLAFYQDGSLYAAETTRVFHLSDPDGDGYFQDQQTVVAGIAAGGNTNRSLIFSQDWEHFFLAIGSSCNVCQEQDPRRATVMRFKADGSEGNIYSKGLRNVIGMDFQPNNSKVLWVDDVERSGLEDGLPPDTVYAIYTDADAGWPFCHAGRIVDPDFGKKDSCSENLLTPRLELEAGSAPYGMEFYLAEGYPVEYQQNLFIALHGSSQASPGAGFKIIRIPYGSSDQEAVVRDFAVGWMLEDGTVWGTPYDLTVSPEGDLYVSDDTAGVIYRIFYQG